MYCMLGKNCYGLFIQERKEKHHNINGLLKLTPPASAVWLISSTWRRKGKPWTRILIYKWKGKCFSISCFKINTLQIWGGISCNTRERYSLIFPGNQYIEFHSLPSLVRSPMLRVLKHPSVTQWFFPVILKARHFSKITTLYLLVNIYHTLWGFKDENNTIMQLHFTKLPARKQHNAAHTRKKISWRKVHKYILLFPPYCWHHLQ